MSDDQSAEGQGAGGKTYSEDYVKTLRQEAANYRTALRAAESERDALKSDVTRLETEVATAKTAFDESLSKVSAAEARALRFEVAQATGLRADAIDRLQGTTREELEADAKTLAELFGTHTPAHDKRPLPGQGSGTGGTSPLSDSPIVAALRAGVTAG